MGQKLEIKKQTVVKSAQTMCTVCDEGVVSNFLTNKCNSCTYKSQFTREECEKITIVDSSCMNKREKMICDVWSDINCNICENSFAQHFEDRIYKTKYHNNCKSCYGMSRKNCSNCNVSFVEKDSYHFSRFCKSCCGILNGSIDDNIVDKDYKLEVTYNVHEKTHTGYCSGAMTDEETNTAETRVYHILKEHSSGINVGDVWNRSTALYELNDEGCSGGNGYCGMGTEYTIESARVIKNE